MYRFLLKPKWLGFHLLVVVLVVLMVNLGLWQLHRLQDRRAFNDEVRSRAAVAVQPFGDVVGGDVAGEGVNPGDVQWRTVVVRGTYLADEQVIVVNRSQSGSAGVNVVTPLRIDDGTLVLVNRGFVSQLDTVPDPPSGEITVVGRLRASQQRSLGGLTDPATGDLVEIQRIDIPRLTDQLPAPVVNVYLDLLESEPAQSSPPIPVPAPELGEGSHLSYMVQWWIFAACVVAGWVLAVRRSAGKAEGTRLTAAVGPTPPDHQPSTADVSATSHG